MFALLARIASSLARIEQHLREITVQQKRQADAQEGILAVLFTLVPKPAADVRLTFHLKGGSSMGEITVADDETTLHSTISFLDAEGHPTTPPDGVVPAYASSDETVAVVTASEDGLTATYEIGAPGDAVITASGLGVTDSEGNEVVGKGTIHVTPGGIAVADIQFATG